MKHSLLLVLTCLFFVSTASAQNLESFTALTGAKVAREKVAQLGYIDAKLLQINTYNNHHQPIFNYSDKYNACYNGKALHWIYIFSYTQDSKVLVISVTNEEGKFVPVVKDDLSLLEFNALDNHVEYQRIDNYTELPYSLVDSDFSFIFKQLEIGIHVIDNEHSYTSLLLTSRQNSQRGSGIYNFDNKVLDSLFPFIWEYSNHGESIGIDGNWGGGSAASILAFSAINGDYFYHFQTTNVEESSNSTTINLSPNPTTGNISIIGTTASPISPVNVKIIDALGRIVHQENLTASADGTFTYVWDSNTEGNIIPSGAYSAVMSVGSLVKSVPFVVVR
ncbi:MAG: hypothetical protein IPM69_07980 [Ignavibacteria bacterium]|nr:hypothetical protein [Ignavibacteria bacterium]